MEYCDFDHWEFVYDDVLHWTWRRFAADGHLRMPSRATFATLDDCICDARLYGFVDHEPVNQAALEQVGGLTRFGLVSAIPLAGSHQT